MHGAGLRTGCSHDRLTRPPAGVILRRSSGLEAPERERPRGIGLIAMNRSVVPRSPKSGAARPVGKSGQRRRAEPRTASPLAQSARVLMSLSSTSWTEESLLGLSAASGSTIRSLKVTISTPRSSRCSDLQRSRRARHPRGRHSAEPTRSRPWRMTFRRQPGPSPLRSSSPLAEGRDCVRSSTSTSDACRKTA